MLLESISLPKLELTFRNAPHAVMQFEIQKSCQFFQEANIHKGKNKVW